MPTTDFTSKLLELEDVIINDVQTNNTKIHVYFYRNDASILSYNCFIL